jgi:predicted 3-demethylubiquinone-9 3-methyltransferase (glyoxalase superfamily)
MRKISPFLWFNNTAQEAADFYCTIFRNAKIIHRSPVMVTFELEGQHFMALNGGPHYTFNEAVSFFVPCETQDEIDYYWNKLIAHGGKEGRCGWLKDKFGLSWQIVPEVLRELMSDPDHEKARRVQQAMMGMNKLDIEKLKSA